MEAEKARFWVSRRKKTMEDRIKVSIDNGVADVRLNRAGKMNALDPAMFTAIAETGERLKQDRSLRAVVLSGEGRAFCAGLDVERIAAVARGDSLLPFADLDRRTHGVANFVQHIVWIWREMPVPVIAAIHGIALGGGFQLALGADLRYVAPGTRLGIIETKWGLVPDMAGTQLMRHQAREDVVRELTYTARTFFRRGSAGLGFCHATGSGSAGFSPGHGPRDCKPQPACHTRCQTIAHSSHRLRRRGATNRRNDGAGCAARQRQSN
jgi:enoyl-CoA hydratase/carnithine racemase